MVESANMERHIFFERHMDSMGEKDQEKFPKVRNHRKWEQEQVAVLIHAKNPQLYLNRIQKIIHRKVLCN
jgi:hypothetical protein